MLPTLGTLEVRALGRVPYREALALQESLVRARAAGEIGDTLLLLEHPPVLTAGRASRPDSIRVDPATLARHGLELVPVTRGGDVTWHGPGQLIGYPICELNAHGRDLHRFLRRLERAIQATLGRWGIDGKPSPGRTGVWVGERKIASIGIAVRQWVSYHGVALNVRPSLEHFELIHPCGLRGVRMTSMADLLGAGCPRIDAVRDALAEETASALGFTDLRRSGRRVAAAAASLVGASS
jgi:lipoate-protein ligase B